MTDGMVTIGNGFAEVGAGAWLMGRAQPAAFFGAAVRRRRKGWIVRDRGWLRLVETTAVAKCADASRPFLTHIPCAAPISAISSKVLVAPVAARRDAELVKAVPMSGRSALCVTVFGLPPDEAGNQKPEDGDGASHFVVMATASRTTRIQVGEGETLSVRPESVVAWTTRRPTGFCPKLSIWDILLPRGPRDLLFTFYGPGIVWAEGSNSADCQAFPHPNYHRRYP